jgi:type I restriction enzyme R subunit
MTTSVEWPGLSFSEADTRAKLIDPALRMRGWTEDLIRREETAGTIEIIGGKARRRARGQVDYTLRLKIAVATQPVAVALIEAKKSSLPPGHGLDQAKAYAQSKRLNVPFVFASNGHQFVEYDRFTGLTQPPRPMRDFPAPEELRRRYEQGMGFSLNDEAAKPLLAPYPGGEGGRRYYQDAAIRATLEKIARCQRGGEPRRALLSLATGAGKTFIAVNLLKRIADAGQLRRALFVCDRDELRAQALGAFQNVFVADAAEVFKTPDGGNNAKNARVHIATYQTLGVEGEDGDASFLASYYPEDDFSHVVIDECHRSAWGKWSRVLTRNPNAVQVGLTATPRQIKTRKRTRESEQDERVTADNLKYFGEPVYEYDIAQAMEDGYLAVCEIVKGRVNLDQTGITLEEIIARSPRDAVTGRPITEEELKERYEKTQYEDQILLPDRVLAMCQDLFQYLLATGDPEQKTIIFCARDRHADDVAAVMNNLYAQWCAAQGRERLDCYAFKCTAASSGNDQLPDFRGAARHHSIAATVDLLTTGVDVPAVGNIVFFKYVRSPISFYQMIGRGTRIDPVTGKLMFRVYDYTGATELFGLEFVTPPPSSGGTREGPSPPYATVIVDGFDVQVTEAGRFVVVQEDGQAKPIAVEEYKSRLATRLIAEAPTLEEFRRRWTQPEERRALLDRLVHSGYAPSVLQMLEEMNDYDLYDVLADLGFGLSPRTRSDRALAFGYKHEDWLKGLPEPTAAAIRAIVGQFEKGGTDGLENPKIFQTLEVKMAGGLAALQAGGKPAELLRETKIRMFSA